MSDLQGDRPFGIKRAGVPEYWVVDTRKKVVERHLLREGKYALAGTEVDEIGFGGLPDVTVDLRRVWSKPEPTA